MYRKFYLKPQHNVNIAYQLYYRLSVTSKVCLLNHQKLFEQIVIKSVSSFASKQR